MIVQIKQLLVPWQSESAFQWWRIIISISLVRSLNQLVALSIITTRKNFIGWKSKPIGQVRTTKDNK